jgi:hypothetical protein
MESETLLEFREALARAKRIASRFTGREGAMVRTKLDEAGLWAYKVRDTDTGTDGD